MFEMDLIDAIILILSIVVIACIVELAIEQLTKRYTVTEIVAIYFKDDIMPPPTSVVEEYKYALRTACLYGHVKAVKDDHRKWLIFSKKEALKYLDEYGKNKKSRRKRASKVSTKC